LVGLFSVPYIGPVPKQVFFQQRIEKDFFTQDGKWFFSEKADLLKK